MKSRSALFLACLLTLQTTWGADIALRIGNHDIHAEIANTPQSRMSGLMQRDSLCPDCGMLFIFPESGRHRFWMKNTKLPLSLAFISADGVILDITEMQPDATDIHSTQGAALYALEMNSGWFAKNGIKQGDRTHGLRHTPQGY
jgi:uncharacterized protein